MGAVNSHKIDNPFIQGISFELQTKHYMQILFCGFMLQVNIYLFPHGYEPRVVYCPKCNLGLLQSSLLLAPQETSLMVKYMRSRHVYLSGRFLSIICHIDPNLANAIYALFSNQFPFFIYFSSG